VTIDYEAKRTYASREIAAEPAKLFAVLRDPTLHSVIDGSGSVKGARGKPQLLEMGSRFGMNMRIGLPYFISNRVVEFEMDRRIAWEHFGKHRWRWEFEPTENGTLVTETFDWSTSRAPFYIEKSGFPARHEAAIERSLERLEAFVVHKSNAL